MSNLTDGPFSLCSDIWDDQQQRFKLSNLSEKEECCVRTCLPNIEECRNICSTIHVIDSKKYNLCIHKCDIDLKKTCENNCTLISNDLGFTNPIYKGTREFGCGDGYYDPININCLKNNKNGILKSCLNNCTSSTVIDCDFHCNHYYNKLEDIFTNKNYNKNVLELVHTGYKSTNSVSIFKIFIFSIGITVLFFLIYVIIKSL